MRQAARKSKKTRFTALLHHINTDLLKRSYLALKRKAAPGIDGVTWQAYGENLEEKLKDLHDRIHRGSYRARPARRIYIPKPDGSKRPVNILCLEDKIVQQAVGSVLEAIFEEDFVGFSYEFRPGRSQHTALDALYTGIVRKKVNWVLDADIQGFFDAMSHDWIMCFLKHRIADKRILRLIAKWLKVGIDEDGRVKRNSRGTPQGAVISPILANIYLHFVFDLWAKAWRRKASGDVIIIRFADDVILGFQHEREGRAFLRDLQARMRKFELTLHLDKTKLIRFGRFATRQCKERGMKKPQTFDFLGFTHFCTLSRDRKHFVIGRKTIGKKMRSKLQDIKRELRKRMHDSIAETGAWLRKVLIGHLNYYAVPGNSRSLSWFVFQVTRQWLWTLRRRSQKARMTWERFGRIAKRFFPPVRISHPFPCNRFDARTQGRSPVR